MVHYGPMTGLPPSLTSSVTARLIAQVPCTSSDTLETLAPYSGERLALLPQCSEQDVQGAFDRARAAQRRWAARPVRERTKVFLRLHDLLLTRQDEIMDLIQAENGKSRRDAFLEVADIANTARYYGRTAHGSLRGAPPYRPVPRPDRDPRAAPAEGRRVDHLAVELPARAVGRRHHPSADRRQRGRPKTGQPDRTDRAVGTRTRPRSGPARRPVADRARPRVDDRHAS